MQKRNVWFGGNCPDTLCRGTDPNQTARWQRGQPTRADRWPTTQAPISQVISGPNDFNWSPTGPVCDAHVRHKAIYQPHCECRLVPHSSLVVFWNWLLYPPVHSYCNGCTKIRVYHLVGHVNAHTRLDFILFLLRWCTEPGVVFDFLQVPLQTSRLHTAHGGMGLASATFPPH